MKTVSLNRIYCKAKIQYSHTNLENMLVCEFDKITDSKVHFNYFHVTVFKLSTDLSTPQR